MAAVIVDIRDRRRAAGPDLQGIAARLDGLVAAGGLPGLASRRSRERFLDCLRQSFLDHAAIRRGDNLPKARLEGTSFEPFRTAIELASEDVDEATWLAFVTTHIGWDRPASVEALYGGLGDGPRSWASVEPDRGDGLGQWVDANADRLRVAAAFGEHRKYQSHRPEAPTATSKVVRSFVRWYTHRGRQLIANDASFEALYRSMEAVAGFGRTARFDFLRLLGLLGIAGLQPACCYLRGASGPQRGMRLLFDAPCMHVDLLERRAVRSASALGVSPMIFEDVACQWQKGIPAAAADRSGARSQ